MLHEVPIVTQYKCSLLVVDDEPYVLSTLAALLSNEFDVLTADCPESAKEILQERDVDIILSDQRMPSASGVDLLEWARQRAPKSVRLLMTGFAELEDAVEAINRCQVFRYIFKPWRNEDLLETLRTRQPHVYARTQPREPTRRVTAAQSTARESRPG